MKLKLLLSVLAATATTAFAEEPCEMACERTTTFNSISLEDCKRMREEFESVVDSCNMSDDHKRDLKEYGEEVSKLLETLSEQMRKLEEKHRESLTEFGKIMKSREEAEETECAKMNELLADAAEHELRSCSAEAGDDCCSDCEECEAGE